MKSVSIFTITAFILLLSACNDKSSKIPSEEEMVRNLITLHSGDFISFGIKPIGRITQLDSVFTDVSEDDPVFISYCDEKQIILDRINELDGIVPYPISQYKRLSDEWDSINDKMNYRRAIFLPEFKGYSCFVESDNGNHRSVYEVILDTAKTKIVSIDYATRRYENGAFYDFELFEDAFGLYGTRDFFFKDTLIRPCISSYTSINELFPSSSKQDLIVMIDGKYHLLNNGGTVIQDIEFDEAVNCLFEDYTYSDILLIKNNGKYGVIDLSSGKVILQCIFDECSISSSRIRGTLKGEEKEYYPDGTEIV